MNLLHERFTDKEEILKEAEEQACRKDDSYTPQPDPQQVQGLAAQPLPTSTRQRRMEGPIGGPT